MRTYLPNINLLTVTTTATGVEIRVVTTVSAIFTSSAFFAMVHLVALQVTGYAVIEVHCHVAQIGPVCGR